MKKIIFLLSMLLVIAGVTTKAQVLTCNADFSFQVSNGNSIQFNSLAPGDSFNTNHYWRYGDGINGNLPFPVHTYQSSGIFNVTHIVYRHNGAGTVVCVDSLTRQLQITSPTSCNLVANFYQYRDSLAVNLYTFYFINTSANILANDSIRWTFGDGNSSNQLNAHHSYAQPGTYNVCLRIIRRSLNGELTNCVSEICHSITIPTNTCNLIAAFTPYRDSLSTIPYSWYFYNTSLNAALTDSVRWTYGDGSSSNQYNGHHAYAQPGTYNVCLRIIRRLPGGLTNCVGEVCHTITIPVVCNLVGSFYPVRDSGSPATYHFVNTSTGLIATDSIRWTFGDGTSSNQYNPTHTYSQPGTYTVCLRIMKRTVAGGTSSCVSETCHTISFTPVCNLHPSFTWRPDSLLTRKIYFTNTTLVSTANSYANWSFGDGTTSSAWHPVHEYTQPGRYYVCLVVYISNTCVASHCDSITVLPAPVSCIDQSQFTITRVTSDPNLVYFIPSHINNDWVYTWTFGDGTGSHDKTVSHRYATAGNYTACLTVFRNANCASTTCKPVSILNCIQLYAAFTFNRDSPAVNRVHFTAFSNGTIVSQQWTITSASNSPGYPVTLNQINPVHTFTDTGYFRVCLRATLSNGCVKEYCQTIYISHVVITNACNLQLFPNPATTQITAFVQLALPQTIDVYIYNTLNVLVRQRQQAGVAGNNNVTVSIGDLPAGIYRLTLIHGNDICNALFQKL